MLEQLDAFADGVGEAPMPERALSKRPDFELSRAPPLKLVERPQRVAGCLPEQPRTINACEPGWMFM